MVYRGPYKIRAIEMDPWNPGQARTSLRWHADAGSQFTSVRLDFGPVRAMAEVGTPRGSASLCWTPRD